MAAILNRGAEITAKHRSIVTWRSGTLAATGNDISFTGTNATIEVPKAEISKVDITERPALNRSDKFGLALLAVALLCGAVGVVTSGDTAFALFVAEFGVAAVASACLAAGTREKIPIINVTTDTDSYRFLAKRRRDADVFCDTATSRF